MQMPDSRPALDTVPPPRSEMEGYMPAGQRSGSHADSVWPYLEEARRLAATHGERPQVQPSLLPPSPSWTEKLLGCLRGDSEVS